MRKGLRYALPLLLLVVSGAAQAQETNVAGRVTSAEGGAALAGVAVRNRRTGAQTMTDRDGLYRIQASAADTLVFTLLGYRDQEVAVAGRARLDVVLTPAPFNLDEIVVTALGRERARQALGYSVQEVAGPELERVREPNMVSSLTGRVAGLVVYNPTGLFETPSIELRGSRPLIVIDNIPQETNLWDVDVSEIESISVLKGTAASALYGSRGKDGAILITTKKGDRIDGHSITYSSSTVFQAGFIAIPEVQTQYGAGYGGRYAFVDGKGGGTFDGAGWIWGPKLDQRDPNTKSGYVEIPQYDSPIDPETGERIPTPWVSRGRNNLENFLETGLVTTHDVAITGGGENGYYRASLSHMYQKGQVPNTKLNRTSFSLSGGYVLGDRVEADAQWTYSRVYTPNYPRTGYGPQNYVYNLLLWMGPDVDVRDLRDYWQEGKEGIQQRHYNYAWYNNPYFLAYENLQGYYEDVNFGRLSLVYTLADDLRLTVRSGARLSNLTQDLRVPMSLILYSDPTNGNYFLETTSVFDLNTDVLLDWRRPLGPGLELAATLGANTTWNQRTNLSSRTKGLNVPGLYNLSNSAADVQSSNRLEKKRTNSLFANVDVAWRDALFLNVTGRNDWSSALPVANNAYFYPSVSLGAVVSELLPLPGAIPFLKLRASWAQVASDLPVYSTTPVYAPGINWNGTPSVAFPDTMLNPAIEPERSTALELGAEMRLLGDRLGLDVTYYRTIDENDIIAFPVSAASGYGARLINANRYRRTGWEVVLSATPLRAGPDLTWDVLLNWALHRRYLDRLPPGVDNLNGVREGERMDLYRGPVFARSPDGQIIYEGGLPTVDPVLRELGHTDPDWTAGLSSALRWKNLGLSVSIDGRYGGVIFSETIRKMWWGGMHPGTVTRWRDDENEGRATYVGDGVVVTGGGVVRDEQGNIVEDTRTFAPNTTPVFWSTWINAYYHGAAVQPNLYDASFVKLREVGLSYRLPRSWASRLRAEDATVSLVGRNLWLWSELDYVDPDPGVDNLQTPSARTIGFNVSLSF